MSGRSEGRSRDRPLFLDFLASSRERLPDPAPLAGLDGTLLSNDPPTGAATFLVELPIGLRREIDGKEASLEMFVLRGDVALEGDSVGAGGYVHVPQGGGGGELASGIGGVALVFWNPNMPSFPPPYTRNRVLRSRELPWRPTQPGAHGTLSKSLRLPDPAGRGEDGGAEYDGGPGGYLRLTYLAPGVDSPFATSTTNAGRRTSSCKAIV